MNPRWNHIHIVVTANDVSPETAMEQLEAWCSRRLNEYCRANDRDIPHKWWTPHGSTKWINDQEYFENVVHYVNERQ